MSSFSVPVGLTTVPSCTIKSYVMVPPSRPHEGATLPATLPAWTVGRDGTTLPRVPQIVVAGAGGLGSIYGGMLALAGHDVVLLARGDHETALGRGELEIRLPDGTRRVSVRVSGRAAGGTVILTSRLFDSDDVLDRVDGRPALAISLQNGLGKNDALIRRFGAERVVPAVSTLAAELVSPGVVESVDLGRTWWRRAGRKHERP